ncbi:MAG: hypothetical protein LQ351_003188 [Letrouitia transgressa]|nr:MAG: hypothetical protein LQ351_003188 [Letrouitia transgressa]
MRELLLIPPSRFHLAVNKPQSLSSAQVLRNLQQVFNPSKFFARWIFEEQQRRRAAPQGQRRKRSNRRVDVKLGHGGTLDPMATGVLIVGVGRGTKSLQSFLDCTKTYHATILFGAATDTYDTLGKVLSRAPYAHLDRQKVEIALQKFRGRIMQRPPLYSALKMDGKPLYEYAREGKEAPREILERPVEAKSIEILKWLSSGSHDYRWPAEEASPEEKEVAQDVMELPQEDPTAQSVSSESNLTLPAVVAGVKRKRPSPDSIGEDNEIIASKRKEIAPQEADLKEVLVEHEDEGLQYSGSLMATEPPKEITTQIPEAVISESPAVVVTEPPAAVVFESPLPAVTDSAKVVNEPPAALLSMIVSSGFYVRTLCHDLGQEVGSLGIMGALTRTRQGDFELGHNVMELEDFSKDEDFWAPKLEEMLLTWQQMDSR